MKKFVILLVVLSILSMIGCGKVTEVVSSAKEIKEAVENTVDQVEEVVEESNTESENQNTDEDQTESESTESGLISEEKIGEYSSYIEEMKHYFTDGHREAGFIYKPTHDQINDIASYISTYKNDMYKSDYADNFERLAENNFFEDEVSDIKMTTNKDGHFYTVIGKGYKSAKQEVETFSFDKAIFYDGNNFIDYKHVRDYVEEKDFDRRVQYLMDGEKLYISLSQYNSDFNTLHQMLVYYDGSLVQVGHKLDVEASENNLLYDLSSTPSGMDDFFGNETFSVKLTFDGSTTTHESNE